jgi:hypothetical protein
VEALGLPAISRGVGAIGVEALGLPAISGVGAVG